MGIREVCIEPVEQGAVAKVSKISTALPAELAAQITAMLEGQSRNDLRERARRLSEAFRARRSTGDAI